MARAAESQPWYFNNLYNPNHTWSTALSIVQIDDGNIGCAISSDSVSGYYYHTCFFKINEYGDLILWKTYGKTGYDYYPGFNGSLSAGPDDSYALFGGTTELSTNTLRGLFYRFNSEGDTLFTRTINSETYSTIIGDDCAHTSDGGFALVGEASDSTNVCDIILIKMDSAGDEVWRTFLGSTLAEHPRSVIETPDKGFVVGCVQRHLGIQESADPVIFKTDSLGQEEWSLNLGGPSKDDKAMVCNTHDSCIMVLTAYADSMYTYDYAYAKINLIKVNLDGDTIWNKKYGPSKPVNLVSNLIVLEGGEVIASGWANHSTNLPAAGWIFKFSADGDSLWYRDYYYYPANPNNPGINYFLDISQCSDNSIVSVGQAVTYGEPQRMWIIKVDSIGCEFPNCWVGMEEDGRTGGREDFSFS